MITFANAKINLGLHITGKRSDGYHLIDSLFYPIPLCDILEITPQNDPHDEDQLTILGDIETGPKEDNLILKAIRALRSEVAVPTVHITLKKLIPSGAGMGGGSSDATHTLKAIRELFALQMTNKQLEHLALTIGADCPFFVENQPRIVQGIGEIFMPAPPLALTGYHLVVIKPDLHIATAEAFRGLQRIGHHETPVKQLLSRPLDTWREALHNDFEESLFHKYPKLREAKELLYATGALYASMTGSGAALYGIFDAPLKPDRQRAFADYFFWQGML